MGLLDFYDDPVQSEAFNRGLLSLGGSMLANNQMRPGQALGTGLPQAINTYDTSKKQLGYESAYKDFAKQLESGQMTPEQMRAQMMKLGQYNPQFATAALKAGGAPGFGSDQPASVAEYEFWKKLDKQGQADFLGLKRQGYQVSDIGGVPTLVPRTPGLQPVPLSTLQREAGGAAAIKGAEKSAQVESEARTTAALDLPKAQASADQTIRLIDELRNHPGRKIATGTSSALPLVPGTSAKDFAVRLEQIKGKQFLEAYNVLKGGGQITQIEGDKAQAAIARMDRAQSEQEFLTSLNDFEDAVRVGIQKLSQKAGQSQTTRRRKYNPATGRIE